MMSSSKRAEIERLVEESHEMESAVSVWQARETVSDEELRRERDRYQSWYARATSMISEQTAREKFRDMYEGGMIIGRVKAFLSGPLDENQFYDPGNPDSPFLRWSHPYETTFRPSFHEQRSLLQRETYAVAEVAPTLTELAEAFARFPNFLQALRSSGRPNVPAPHIGNEADLQVLIGACLRLMYEDVRPEDYVPEYGGGRSRVDFLLPEVGIVVETKMTRETLADRKVGEELMIDWSRYSQHPDCRGILALVYDPERRLVNPAGLQSDLTQENGNPATRVLVMR
ncbi:PD-(D/E)XK nuclease domain-containing protein [Streptomyces sp. NPDC054784]